LKFQFKILHWVEQAFWIITTAFLYRFQQMLPWKNLPFNGAICFEKKENLFLLFCLEGMFLQLLKKLQFLNISPCRSYCRKCFSSLGRGTSSQLFCKRSGTSSTSNISVNSIFLKFVQLNKTKIKSKNNESQWVFLAQKKSTYVEDFHLVIAINVKRVGNLFSREENVNGTWAFS